MSSLPRHFKKELHNLPLSKQKSEVIKLFDNKLKIKIELYKGTGNLDINYLNMRKKQFESEVDKARSESELIEIMFRWSAIGLVENGGCS